MNMRLIRWLEYDDVFLEDQYSEIISRQHVSLEVHLGEHVFGMPVIASPMDTICGWEMARAMANNGGLGILHRFMSIEENTREYRLASVGDLLVGVSVGVKDGEHGRAEALVRAGAKIVCVDVARGYSKIVGDMVKWLDSRFDDLFIIAGSTASKDGVKYLADCGADAVRVGIGNGSVCTTSSKTGIGMPSLSSIIECCESGVPIIADGGLHKPADIAKAIAAGASMVMLGRMLAGTDETPVKSQWVDGHFCKPYRGMASVEANSHMSPYATGEGKLDWILPQGKVSIVLKDICGGLRSSMSYCGARNLEEFRQKAKFVCSM